MLSIKKRTRFIQKKKKNFFFCFFVSTFLFQGKRTVVLEQNNCKLDLLDCRNRRDFTGESSSVAEYFYATVFQLDFIFTIYLDYFLG